jgi:hypothetical protein
MAEALDESFIPEELLNISQIEDIALKFQMSTI